MHCGARACAGLLVALRGGVADGGAVGMLRRRRSRPAQVLACLCLEAEGARAAARPAARRGAKRRRNGAQVERDQDNKADGDKRNGQDKASRLRRGARAKPAPERDARGPKEGIPPTTTPPFFSSN